MDLHVELWRKMCVVLQKNCSYWQNRSEKTQRNFVSQTQCCILLCGLDIRLKCDGGHGTDAVFPQTSFSSCQGMRHFNSEFWEWNRKHFWTQCCAEGWEGRCGFPWSVFILTGTNNFVKMCLCVHYSHSLICRKWSTTRAIWRTFVITSNPRIWGLQLQFIERAPWRRPPWFTLVDIINFLMVTSFSPRISEASATKGLTTKKIKFLSKG